MTGLRRGLTLGKFAPFHRGHQYLIETALAEMDEVIVLVYDFPGVINVPLNVRANWIRRLYPAVRVIEAWDPPPDVGNTHEIQRKNEEYIFALLQGTRISHFYSSEFYGAHVSAALGAINRQVDSQREAFPVSGTAVRADPYGCRQFIHPLVYRDLVVNAVFLGAPSTGKTTLVQALALELRTVWMPEYGREYWDRYQVNNRLSLDQLVELAERHLCREELLIPQANNLLLTDTNAITTYLFSLYYHGTAHPRLIELADQAAARYDVVFVCDVDIPYEDSPDRSGEANRLMFHRRLLGDLAARKIHYFPVSGSHAARMDRVFGVLNRFSKFDSIAAVFAPQS